MKKRTAVIILSAFLVLLLVGAAAICIDIYGGKDPSAEMDMIVSVFRAAEDGDWPTVKEALKKDPELAMYYPVKFTSKTLLYYAIRDGNEEMVTLLLENGAK